MTRTKQNALIFMCAAALLTLMLAMSLPDLKLLPGVPYNPTPLLPTLSDGVAAGGGENLTMRIFQGVVALAVVFLPVYIVYGLLTKDGRQRLLAQVAVIAFFLLLAQVLRNIPDEDKTREIKVVQPGRFVTGTVKAANALTQDNPPPEFVLLLVVLIAGIIAAIIGFYLWRTMQQPQIQDESAFEQLAEEARNAMAAISAGDDFEPTIIRCYQKMGQVLQEERGITRHIFMTPREFEERLVNRGLPSDALHTLTGLFEQARYSSIPAGAREHALAMTCLQDIIAACKTLDYRLE